MTSPPRLWQRPALAAVATWLFVLLCFLYGDNVTLHGEFGLDPDNYSHAGQVRDWLSGAHGWFQTAQDRLEVAPGASNGPDGFSRLSDLPLAATTLLFLSFMPVEQALLWASVILPLLIQLPLLLWLLAWAFRPLLGVWSWALGPLVLFEPYLLVEFVPGRIDHHSWQLLLLLLSLGAALRLLLPAPEKVARNGAWCALAIALSAAVGLEALPWQALILAALGLALLDRPAVLAPAGRTIAFLLPGLTALLLALLRTPAQMREVRLDVLSLVTLKLMVAAGFLFALVSWQRITVLSLARRCTLLALAGAGVAGLLLLDTPDLLQGAWLGFDPFAVAVTRVGAQEQHPVLSFNQYWPGMVALSLAGCAGFVAAWIRHPALRWPLALVAMLCLVTGGLALFYAVRILRFWWLFGMVGVVFAVLAAARWAQLQLHRPGGLPRILVVLTLLVGSVLGTNAWLDAAQRPGGRLELTAFAKLCDVPRATWLLNSLPQGGTSRVLLTEDLGPYLAWGTADTYLGGSMNNVALGLKARRDFFLQSDPALAATVLRRQQIDLLFACDLGAVANAARDEHKDFYNRPLRADDPDTMLQRLNRGEIFPWLQPVVSVLGPPEGRLYRVLPDKLPDESD